MKKRIIHILLAIIAVVVSIIIIKVFIPRPIADSGIEEIVRVQVNFNYGEEDSKLTDAHFIPDRIIECISKYKEQRTLARHKGYAMKNVQLSILIRTKDGAKEIVVGKDTYSQKGSGPSYRILDEEKFKQEIFDVCGYVVENESINPDTEQSFVGTVLEETTTYMIVEPAEDEYERTVAEQIKIEFGTEHKDYLYGTGRLVVIYYKGEINTDDGKMTSIKSDDISTEGFREWEMKVVPSSETSNKKIINKWQPHDSDSDSYWYRQYNLYYHGLEDVIITVDGEQHSLAHALKRGKITMSAILAKANKDVSDGIIEDLRYKDGGSAVFKYPDYTIVKYHTLDGNDDMYIGTPDMDIHVKDK